MTSEAPRFSIVVPSYNQGRFLDACLRSLVAQRADGADLEIIVLDAGSQDETLEIIKDFADDLFFWRSSPDGGQAAALHEGFAMARGEIFGWLNSDDVLMEGALSLVDGWLASRSHAVGVYGDAVWIDQEGEVIKPKREIQFVWNIFAYGFCYIPQPSMFFTADAYRRSGGIDATLQCAFDYDLWHRLSTLGSIGHIETFLSLIRDHPGTKTNQQESVFEQENKVVRERYVRASGSLWTAAHAAALTARVGYKLITGRYRGLSSQDLEVVRCVLLKR